MTGYEFDGTVFDLTVPQVDCGGVEWRFTGQWTEAGEPLMQSMESRHVPHFARAVPLPTVYRDHGPLIPMNPRPRLTVSAWLTHPTARVAA